MMVLQSIKMALNALVSSKMRSFLTMLGIIIGVIALVVLVSLVNSATDSVTDQISSLARDMLTVSIQDDKNRPIRLEDLDEVEDLSEIDLVAPSAQASVTAKYDRENEMATMLGTTSAYEEIQGLELESGRFLRNTDVDNSSYVTVLNHDAADELFGRTDIVGETVSLNGRSFLIVGVLAETDNLMSLFSSMTFYVPFSTATRLADNISTVTTFYATASNQDTLTPAENQIENYLLDRFRQDESAYSLRNSSTMMDTMNEVTDMLSLLLGGIAAISLLVGGIGIMNIMLVSVTERTREIGIRKAIGASQGSILMQFMVEALVISIVGCIIGVILSWGIIQIASIIAADRMTFTLSTDVIGIAVAFSLSIGLLFGIYPANKAAKMRPIEALRFQ